MNGSPATWSDRPPVWATVPLGFLFVLAVLACVPAALTGDRPDLHVNNGTALPVTIVLDGTALGVVGANASKDFPGADLPELPWRVEARSPSGRVLTTMDVAPGQVRETHWPDGRSEFAGGLGRADLSCGRLDVWVGAMEPSGPAPGPGQPGDCAP